MRRTRQIRGAFPIRGSTELDRKRPILAFDLNGVLADANALLLAEVRAKYNISVHEADLTTYDALKRRLEHATGNPLVGRWLKDRVNDPAFIAALRPYPEATELWARLDVLGTQIERRIVTGHLFAHETVIATETWLSRHGFDARCDFSREKDGWCHQTRARWIIEDSPAQAMSCSDAGTKVLLVSKPYNRALGDDGAMIVRMSALLDVFGVIWDDLCHE